LVAIKLMLIRYDAILTLVLTETALHKQYYWQLVSVDVPFVDCNEVFVDSNKPEAFVGIVLGLSCCSQSHVDLETHLSVL